MIVSQLEKEQKVFDSVLEYQKSGLKKSAAVRRTMVDFGYVTEAAVYCILKREGKRREGGLS